MNQNPNCDGGNCRHSAGQVRRLPTGGDGAVILCLDCYRHEIAWRRERNRELAGSCKFDLPAWDSLEVYLDGPEMSICPPKTKAQRIAMIEANLRENEELYRRGDRPYELFKVCQRDGSSRISEIRAGKI